MKLPETFPGSDISVVIPTWRRPANLRRTLARFFACNPAPREIIIHIDAGDAETAPMLDREFAGKATWFQSTSTRGPGGGRNLLLQRAQCPLVASFDDDSYPIDEDYFARVKILSEQFDDASIFSAAVYCRGESVNPDAHAAEWVADFVGAGCIYRREAFLATSGYVPLPLAYGMEEVDLALRLHARGKKILKTRWLRIFHDTDLQHHADPKVTALSIANLALLTYLRYPLSLWPTGLGQCFNRIFWLVRYGRTAGIFNGLTMIPRHLRRYAGFRELVEPQSVKSYLALRKAPISAEFQ